MKYVKLYLMFFYSIKIVDKKQRVQNTRVTDKKIIVNSHLVRKKKSSHLYIKSLEELIYGYENILHYIWGDFFERETGGIPCLNGKNSDGVNILDEVEV